MEIFWVNNKKDIFLGLEISMNLHTIWKVSQVILSFQLNLEKSESTFATVDIILFTGWDSDSMEPRLFSILQLLLMDCLNLFGEFKLEMLLLQTTILLLESIE
eukprot:TRINITY_DN16363_c0_g1_i1.p1 TRINITY_DN16363_c0_g1~~TRINITY_DN16363_c0_g1_i1.p1  ORF type:complete len:103 (-),score=3.01 TRINITY_DN16363_c0_g1_i1:198-506(-)